MSLCSCIVEPIITYRSYYPRLTARRPVPSDVPQQGPEVCHLPGGHAAVPVRPAGGDLRPVRRLAARALPAAAVGRGADALSAVSAEEAGEGRGAPAHDGHRAGGAGGGERRRRGPAGQLGSLRAAQRTGPPRRPLEQQPDGQRHAARPAPHAHVGRLEPRAAQGPPPAGARGARAARRRQTVTRQSRRHGV